MGALPCLELSVLACSCRSVGPVVPNLFLAPGAGFIKDNLSTAHNWMRGGGSFRMIFIRSMQPSSLAFVVRGRVRIPMGI